MLKILSAITFLLIYGAAIAEPKDPIVIIEQWNNFYKDPLPKDGKWLGLFCSEKNCEIKETMVNISSSIKPHPAGGDNENVVTINAENKPLALFHGASIQSGKIQTWYKSDNSDGLYAMSETNDQWSMTLPWGDKPLSIHRNKILIEQRYTSYETYITDGKSRQVIYSGSSYANIHWMGDLNGDNKIDVLLTINPGESCHYDQRLYISNNKTENDFLLLSARTEGTQAQCGC